MADHAPSSHRQSLLIPGVFARSVEHHRAAATPSPALARLRADAEEACLAPLRTVLDKAHVPPSGDKQDYFSLSIYFWPDPSKPDGLPYVPRDGQANPETAGYDRDRFVAMAHDADTLALAYAFTGDERYAEKAAAVLRAWFLDERTGMRPNMLFAQYIPGDDVVLPWKDYPARFVPGTAGRKGVYVSFGGVIEDLHLIPLTDAVRLLRPSPHWTDADDAGIRRWYAHYIDWLLTHPHGLDEAACRNNHGSWYWADIACFLDFVGRGDEARHRVAAILPERLTMQIEPDGSQPEELVRAISKSYTMFTIASFTNLAVSSEAFGFDAWGVATGDGRSIRGAIDWVLPYLTHEKAWAWKQIKPANDAEMLGPLRAAAQRFADPRYDAAARAIAQTLPADHRFHLLYDA